MEDQSPEHLSQSWPFSTSGTAQSNPLTSFGKDAEGKPANTAPTCRAPEQWIEPADLEVDVTKSDRIDEFPAAAIEPLDPIQRREFLRVMGASLALAGLSGCYARRQKVLPLVNQPEDEVLGEPLFFATSMVFNESAMGLTVRSNEGRPTKVEGNPKHPFSCGATSIFEQAELLSLYDPDRSQSVQKDGIIETWDTFVGQFIAERERHRSDGGRTLGFLLRDLNSPTLLDQVSTLQRIFPAATWHRWDPGSRDSIRQGLASILGQPAEPLFDLDKAEVVVALDDDFLFAGLERLRSARSIAKKRAFDRDNFERQDRLYVAEPSPTITGSMADDRLSIAASQIASLIQEFGARAGLVSPTTSLESVAARRWVGLCWDALRSHPGQGLITAGLGQPPAVHALVHQLNNVLRNVGQTVRYHSPIQPKEFGDLPALLKGISTGQLDALIILGGNPVYDSPPDLGFSQALRRLRFSLHLSSHANETSSTCHWHIPQRHFLEQWSDTITPDGVCSIVQPLTAPLFASYSAHELLAVFSGSPVTSAYDIVREYWRSRLKVTDFETRWRQALSDGIIATIPPAEITTENPAGPAYELPQSRDTFSCEVCFRLDPTLWDGRYANNGWLQELPKPFTRVTWDNPALISPELARTLRVSNGDCIELKKGSQTLKINVWILPGQATRTISLHLGGGRTGAGRIGNGVGTNTFAFRLSQSPWILEDVQVQRVEGHVDIASTQRHHSMAGRKLVRTRTPDEFRQKSIPTEDLAEAPKREETLYDFEDYLKANRQWGMVINLNTCIGCNACILACQSENNIPVVGRTQVLVGREMHWIRIDRYFEGSPDNPKFRHQPVPCMHCETAPCELVCPVEATLHSSEGLNQQVYNRCIGTRYCSNNCPYKVRRFNFLQYTDARNPLFQLYQNPQVTVRSRGVMEKCTYCIQRIRTVEISREKEGHPVRDGDIVTACMQVCPTEAIVFGDIADRSSRVAQLKLSSLNYGLLEDLNTRPRTSYLAKVEEEKGELG